MSGLPPDLQRFWDDTQEADQRAEALANALTDAQFFWQPEGGRRWSVALCLDHLAVANTVYGRQLAEAIEQAKRQGWRRGGPAAPGLFGRLFANSLEPPVKIRSSAPGKIKPMPSRSRLAIMQAYRDAHEHIRRLIEAAADIDANRATFRNPFIRIVNVRVATGFQVISAHDRRHLWQADNVVQELRAARIV